MAAGIIATIELAFGAVSAAGLIIKAIIAYFQSPQGQAVAEAAQRIVADAERLIGGTAGITTPLAEAKNTAKLHYALTTLQGDLGIGENQARIAVAGALEVLKATLPTP